jgi:sugar/nucleoside kinase (ribokinase family)
MMSGPPDLVCVGHVVQEMIYFPDSTSGPVLGSPPAYCSVAAARQGTRTGLVTKIGLDTPAHLLRPIVEAGVDTTGVDATGLTTQTALVYDSRGNKEIRYPAKAEPITAKDVPASYVGCAMVYVCTMDSDVLVEDIPGVVSLGRASAVDLGGYGGAHMGKEHREATASLADLACRVSSYFNVVKASDEDAALIFRREDPDAAAEKLLACGPDVVVITAGRNGALVYTRHGRCAIPPVLSAAIDTTGGGDTFMAGFLSEYLRSRDPVKSAQWGCATASWMIEQTGGVRLDRMPTFDQVRERANAAYAQHLSKES